MDGAFELDARLEALQRPQSASHEWEDRLQRTIALFLVPTVIAFAATHGLGLINAGYNVDDLFEIKGDPGWTLIGRYGMEFFYSYILGRSYSDPFQIVAAYLTLAGCCRLLVPAWVRQRDLWAGVLFVAGITHPYFAEILNFSAHVWAYPLALLVSLAAFRLSMRAEDGFYPVSGTLLAAILLAASLSVYQSFALFGSVVVLERLFFPLRRLSWKTFVAPAVTLVLGFLLYKLGDRIVLWALDQTASGRFSISPSNLTFEKLRAFVPLLADLAVGRALFVPAAFAWVSAAVYAALALVLAWVALACLRRGRVVEALRMPPAALAIAAPILGPWLLIALPEYPARAVAGFGLVPPLLAMWLWPVSPGAATKRLLAAAIALFAVFNIVTSSNIWTDQAHAAKRDEAVAAALAAVVSQTQGVTRIAVVGKQEYRDLWWNESLGMSAMNTPWSRGWLVGTFFPGIQVHSVDSSPEPCSAFPSPGSTVRSGDRLFICLEPRRVGFESVRDCRNPLETNGFQICMMRGSIVMKSATCERPGRTRFFLHHFQSGRETNMDFDVSAGETWNGSCYWIRNLPNDKGDRVDIGEFDLSSGARLWEAQIRPSPGP